ncbi:GH-E family nuclease [Chryseobacterium wangxinyae]|uniref:GH-E family nuclease n=1 Tax=Chryseobacterium sp. CY350 TaxID=2997336 RepID=UPI002272297B|nr:GH-E family nuclease [Chryseobacterium sp. CY350]MCY0976720.1 GH-E family nuclease [Chryseobacterium sp. CY350]WBZ96721.1 GH-E family nuclease [Chryseobacterium sp. CY350]
MADEQYLTEKHYVVCDKGMSPKKMKVTSQDFVTFSGDKAATELDTLKGNNFICLGKTAFIAGAVAGIAVGICAMIPGPGWLVAAIIAAAILAAVAIGALKCKAAAPSRKWENTAEKFEIEGNNALTLSSVMICNAEGGTITPKETAWEAWGSAALTNLGHVANFAFGFLAGRGAVGMVGGAAGATTAAGVTGARQTAVTFGREFGKQFVNTARKELIEQFTFKGFKNASLFCKTMRGLGIGGAYYEQYNIWSSDKSAVEKLQESGVSLILGIFAAKGATLVCFPAGTKVHTQNGLANIEDLYEGDFVLTYNEETKKQEYKPILVKHERFTQQMLSLELPTGEFVRVTPEHRFYCNDEWIEAGSLRAGDLLHLKGGDYTTIISIETLPHYEKVYNFDIEDNENYYVTEDGILVHNGYGSAADDLGGDPPGTFRDSSGRLRNDDGSFANDPNTSRSNLRDNRPSYGGTQVDDVWNNAIRDADGNVIDPNTGEILIWDKTQPRIGQWDMGHKPGHSYKDLCDRYERGDITYEQFLKEYRDSSNYWPESPSSNRSNKYTN